MGSKKMLTRSHFLKIGASLVGMSSMPLGLGCAARGDGACDENPVATIAANHGHRLVVSLGDVLAGVDATYDIRGEAPHSHLVRITAEQFARLRKGDEVMVMSTVELDHSHPITIECG